MAQEASLTSGARPAPTRIGVVLHILEDQPWGAQVKADLLALLAADGLELEFADPHGDPGEQVAMVERFLRARVNVLLVAPIDGEALKPVLRRYQAAGIPVIAFDNDLGEPALYRSLILADNALFGRKMGEFFAEVTEGRANLVELCGPPSTSAAADRSRGFREAIAATPDVRVVESCTAGWRRDRAQDQMIRLLENHPHLDGVFAQNDEMAVGAWEAAVRAGRAEELLITGIDALRGENGLHLVMQGRLAATLINPSPARAAVDALHAVLAGERCLERTLLQTSLLRSGIRISAWKAYREAASARADTHAQPR